MLLIRTPFRDMPLGRTMLPQYPAGSALRHFELVADMVDTGTTTSGAQKFPFAASFRINLSSVRSDTARLSCSFSF